MVGTAAGATATAASTAGIIGIEVATDPVPITTTPPTTERTYLPSFRTYAGVRRRAADDATATAAASTAETMVTPPSPDVNVDVSEGATASPAFATTVSSVSS